LYWECEEDENLLSYCWDDRPLFAMYDIIPLEPYSFIIMFSKELSPETESAVTEFILP